MVKKEEMKDNNQLGIVGVVLGILSIVFLSNNGIIIGIIGLIFSFKQKKKNANRWSRAGIILNSLGIIIGIIMIVVVVKYMAGYLAELGLEGL